MYFTADNALQNLTVYCVGTGLICVPILAKHMERTVAWLDHVVCTGTAYKHVLPCETLDDITFGDHLPV